MLTEEAVACLLSKNDYSFNAPTEILSHHHHPHLGRGAEVAAASGNSSTALLVLIQAVGPLESCTNSRIALNRLVASGSCSHSSNLGERRPKSPRSFGSGRSYHPARHAATSSVGTSPNKYRNFSCMLSMHDTSRAAMHSWWTQLS